MARPDYPGDWYWIVGGDESRAYSTAAADYVSTGSTAYNAWAQAGGHPTRIASEDELRQVLTDAGIGRGLGHRQLRKALVSERVEALGKFNALWAVLQSSPALFNGWFMPGWEYVYADDPNLLAGLAAAGLTPDEIAQVTA